ncbi:TPA: lipopolysaccharide biosynthesis protein RfbH [Candidatus Woesearchaeota archaeon]|nr:MAG: CDP-6-deoxy-D-xylo-4-hexulose-3-dehydrase [archaeon GW2011_AR11]MBS3111341.1 lipopolysaccharide biosynthesis protein RfbH [Candidatus Woesearchaeota archaeon]HIH04913.1 lipopolysaccharide biosynthesis protein RfbH [Candidatus Woesearchaeota archaeon]HIH91300.1 lipopolysaccharide biosynthesis protein RfbH [Candidatus Woesearchaeota archaeon]HII64195.1 lipopolysaccharide biosynthesis protein RfbH [Candidatus Woesearchaeota archaeon]
MDTEQQLRQEIRKLVQKLYRVKFAGSTFHPGADKLNYAGRVFDEKEMEEAVDTLLDFELTHGKKAVQFERDFAAFSRSKFSVLTNSGSSANLLAMTALKSKRLPKHLTNGDKVLTPAMTFPTTLAPILQNNLRPVFVDVDSGTYNVAEEALKEAMGRDIKAVVVPHTLGNLNNMDLLMDLQKDHGFLLVEDTCDALGSTFNGRHAGTFGQLGTVSFYPAHHMTLGEGGAILAQDGPTVKVLKSLREWGRDCWCLPNMSNTCGKRFGWKLGALPEGYDHKYIYSEIGYNLKVLDLQAAIGLEQLKKLPAFIRKRKENFTTIYNHLREHQDTLLLPTWHPKADPSWFAFPITVREDAGFSRKDLTSFLESKKIETRMIFGGNILKQPAYMDIGREIRGSLENTDRIMSNSFFVGVYPGITEEKMGFMLESFDGFFTGRT